MLHLRLEERDVGRAIFSLLSGLSHQFGNPLQVVNVPLRRLRRSMAKNNARNFLTELGCDAGCRVVPQLVRVPVPALGANTRPSDCPAV